MFWRELYRSWGGCFARSFERSTINQKRNDDPVGIHIRKVIGMLGIPKKIDRGPRDP